MTTLSSFFTEKKTGGDLDTRAKPRVPYAGPQANFAILDLCPEFAKTSVLDDLRDTEYSRLDNDGDVYLDYAGSGLAAAAQLRAHNDRVLATLYGNPHSDSPSSQIATMHVQETRLRILRHFNASGDDYMVIFTPNATGAARLVGESYNFGIGKRLVLTSDNHNSINSLREFAKRGHSSVTYVHTRPPKMRIWQEDVDKALRKTVWSPAGLFAYPAQSNFSGVQHPLQWVALAKQRGYDVLLDAAAFLPTSTLDLSPTSPARPDFIIVSFYKLFGYPTGVGCLIARRESVARLKRPSFSGGTVQAVSVRLLWHRMAPNEKAFEDGTVNFLSIPDVAVGLDWLAKIGMDVISTRVRCLTHWFIARLLDLRHGDGTAMIRIYGPTDTELRGATIAFNFIDAEGKVVDERLVAMESCKAKISLRTGCFCNPGCAEDAFGLDRQKLRPLIKEGEKVLDRETYVKIVGLSSGGAIRVSFGIASSPADVDCFFHWAANTYRDRITSSDGLRERR